MRSESNKEYKKSLKIVRKILNKIDPESLRPGQLDGAPENEYDVEVQAILNFIIHNQEEIKKNNYLLIQEINKIWCDNFEYQCPDAEVISNELLKLML